MGISNEPGGGFSEVKGYNPPAGTQADEQRRAREADEQRRRNDESMRRAAEIDAQNRAAARASDASPRTRPRDRSSPAPSGGGGRVRGAGVGASRLEARPRAPRPARPQRPWNPVAGVIGFAAATIWLATLIPGDNKWILAAAGGLFAGAIIGRLWKLILVVAALGGAAWIYQRMPHARTPQGSPTLAVQPTPVPATPVIQAPTNLPSPVAPLPDFEPAPGAKAPAPVAPVALSATFLGPAGLIPDNILLTDGQFLDILVIHDDPLDFASLRHVEYSRGAGAATAVLTSGARLDLGAAIAPEGRAVWEKSPSISFAGRGAANLSATVELKQVP